MQLDRVDQVAVVGERELAAVAAAAGAAVHRLRVLPLVGARGRVADVADREIAAERLEVVLLEDLADEAQRALGDDVAARIGCGDAGRFLPAMLQGIEGEVRVTADVEFGSVDPEDAALVPRSVAMLEVERHRGAFCRQGSNAPGRSRLREFTERAGQARRGRAAARPATSCMRRS